MHILVLTPYIYGTAPGPRTSIELWERVLRPAGITFEYAAFESQRLHDILYEPGHFREKTQEMLEAAWRRLPLMRRLGEFDAVLVYREAALFGPALLERWVAQRGKPIIYQLDDPLYVPYRSPSNGYMSYLKFFGKVKSIIRMSKLVIVNSPQHREFASPFNDNIWEVPSVVDQELFNYLPRASATQSVCVGWSGSPSTVKNLQEIRSVIRDLGCRPDVEFRFMGSADVDLPEVRHTALPWCAETEVDDLRHFDIGLVPLPTDEWTRRKFYLKLVQYMALGIPPVATPLGANSSVIDHGVTGFLADSPSEWRHSLERLIDEPRLREDMGQAAADIAASRYTLSANAERIVDAFRSIL